jgi:hypothetical protein
MYYNLYLLMSRARFPRVHFCVHDENRAFKPQSQFSVNVPYDKARYLRAAVCNVSRAASYRGSSRKTAI